MKLERKESVNRSLTNISPSLLESTVRSIVMKGGLMVSEANGCEPDRPGEAQHRHCEGKNPHGCVDKAADGEIVEAGLAGNGLL